MSTIVKTQPTFEPLSLQEAKDHLHVDTDDDNASIYNYLKTARRYLDHLCQLGKAEVTMRYGGPGRPEHRYTLGEGRGIARTPKAL